MINLNLRIAQLYLKKAQQAKETGDLKTALKKYQKAASLGGLCGYYQLGMCYLNGDGVEIDVRKAFEFFKQGSSNYVDDKELLVCNREWNDKCSYMVAKCYEEGLGIDQNYEKAVYYFEQCKYSFGFPVYTKLMRYCRDGIGIKQDLDKAISYAKRILEKFFTYEYLHILEEATYKQFDLNKLPKNEIDKNICGEAAVLLVAEGSIGVQDNKSRCTIKNEPYINFWMDIADICLGREQAAKLISDLAPIFVKYGQPENAAEMLEKSDEIRKYNAQERKQARNNKVIEQEKAAFDTLCQRALQYGELKDLTDMIRTLHDGTFSYYKTKELKITYTTDINKDLAWFFTLRIIEKHCTDQTLPFKRIQPECLQADFDKGRYYEKEGQNFEKAAEYYKSAALKGHVEAMYRLGILYTEVMLSFYEAEGKQWLKKAYSNGWPRPELNQSYLQWAKEKDPEALRILGIYYCQSDSRELSSFGRILLQFAIDEYEKLDYGEAMYEIHRIKEDYFFDLSEKHWLHKAANTGYGKALADLSYTPFDEDDDEECEELRDAANATGAVRLHYTSFLKNWGKEVAQERQDDIRARELEKRIKIELEQQAAKIKEQKLDDFERYFNSWMGDGFKTNENLYFEGKKDYRDTFIDVEVRKFISKHMWW